MGLKFWGLGSNLSHSKFHSFSVSFTFLGALSFTLGTYLRFSLRTNFMGQPSGFTPLRISGRHNFLNPLASPWVPIQSSSEKCSENRSELGTLFGRILIQSKLGNPPENPSEMLNQKVTFINCFLCSTVFRFGEGFGKDFREDFRKLIVSWPCHFLI